MDLIRILRSLEEFLYELMSWLIFYPRTLLRILRNPVAIARYTQSELKQPDDQQFTEMVSPLLTLILSVILAHGIEMIARVPMLDTSDPVTDLLFGTQQGLLATRSIFFSLYALTGAAITMKVLRIRIDRETLREPFYIHAYLIAPFALAVSTAAVMLREPDAGWILGGLATILLATIWLIWAHVAIYRYMLKIGRFRAFLHAAIPFAVTSSLLIAGGLLLGV